MIISDLHSYEFDDSNEKLFQLIRQQSPDLILILGDMLNSDSVDSHVICEVLENLGGPVPVYYALGNHELDYMEHSPQLIQELEAAGAKVLDLEYEDIEVNGQKIRIGGMYDYAFALDGNNTVDRGRMDPEVYDFLTDFQDTDHFKLMLSHRPDSFIFGDASKTWNIDLVVSGHTHGGQVVLPIFGGLYGGDQGWFPEYVHGVYERDNMSLFVTSGLSSNKKAVPRFNNPPEIAVVTLVGED